MLLTELEGHSRKVRALFLSDIHLGTRACRTDDLLSFIKAYDASYIFLIGDIVDFWAMSRSVYWPAQHNTVVQKILRKARSRTKVYLIPGNHDEALRDYVGTSFGNIRIERDYVHTAADGKRYWLVHVNRLLSLVRRKLGVSGHWSLADYAKRNVLRAVSFISDFENALVRDAKRRRVDGVICGHIHTPMVKRIDGITYVNCGDWVDNCTAIVEHCNGRMELVRWSDARGSLILRAVDTAEATSS